MTSRKLQGIYRRAAEKQFSFNPDHSDLGACYSISIACGVRAENAFTCGYYEAKECFAGVFRPSPEEREEYKVGSSWWLSERSYTPESNRRSHAHRVFALLFAAEMVRTGDITP